MRMLSKIGATVAIGARQSEWRDRHVTFPGPDPQVFMFGELHFDLAEFAVVIAVGQLISDQCAWSML
jgi:hypothetical protein